MSLTLYLGQKVQGDKLIDIVEASMNDVKDYSVGWKVRKKKGKRRDTVYVNVYTPCVLVKPCIAISDGSAMKYDMAVNSKEKTDDVFLCLQRYGGYGRRQAFGFDGPTTPLEWILVTPLIFSDRDTYLALFATNDSIFTFLNPNRSYSEIKFYANAAYAPPEKECGRVDKKDSPQFRKIEPVYSKLVQNILKKMPIGHPYR